MDWTEFETIVRWIYETLGQRLGVEIEGYGTKCRCTGKSGVGHQIDVLTSHSDGLHTYRTAIECKWWNEKVNKDIVMKAESIREDCNFDKTVIVSKLGFTEDAIRFAAYTNVQLVELQEYNLKISGDTLTKFYQHLTISQPELLDIHFTTDSATAAGYARHPLLHAQDRCIYTGQKEMLEVNQLVNAFLNEEVLPVTHFEIVSSHRTFDKRTKLKSRNLRASMPITGIRLRGFNRLYTKLDNDYFQNRIWLALKLVFEKKQLMVTLDGDIQPWDNGEPLQGVVGKKMHFDLYGNMRQFKITKNINLLDPPADLTGPTSI